MLGKNASLSAREHFFNGMLAVLDPAA